MKDLDVMREVLKSRLAALPPPRRNIKIWEEFWRSHSEAWKRLVSKFVGEVAKDETSFLTACARAKVCTGFISPAQEEAEDEWKCDMCSASFASQGRLAIHASRAHAVQCWLRDRVSGSVCPFCKCDFRSRLRLRTHLLRGRSTCVERARSLPILPVEVRDHENEQEGKEAQQARREGRHSLQGPPCRRAKCVAPGAEME